MCSPTQHESLPNSQTVMVDSGSSDHYNSATAPCLNKNKQAPKSGLAQPPCSSTSPQMHAACLTLAATGKYQISYHRSFQKFFSA